SFPVRRSCVATETTPSRVHCSTPPTVASPALNAAELPADPSSRALPREPRSMPPVAVQLSYRLGGADGVAVEARKWEWALQELGFPLRPVAGGVRGQVAGRRRPVPI